MKEIRIKNEGNETLIEMKIWHAFIVHLVPFVCNLPLSLASTVLIYPNCLLMSLTSCAIPSTIFFDGSKGLFVG